jgi:hypothetical protein
MPVFFPYLILGETAALFSSSFFAMLSFIDQKSQEKILPSPSGSA